jgi:hypothetical protein
MEKDAKNFAGGNLACLAGYGGGRGWELHEFRRGNGEWSGRGRWGAHHAGGDVYDSGDCDVNGSFA